MSTQLILLPQTYLGVSSGTGTGQLVSDGVSFNSLNASTVYAVGTASPLNYLISTVSFSANIWNRWKTSGSAGAFWLTPANPKETAGNLELNTVGGATGKSSGSGVIQKLSNLSIGTVYTIELKISAPTPPPAIAGHKVKVVIYSGATIIHNHVVATGFHGVVATTFTAQSANDIITVSNYDNVDADILINYISVKGSIVQTLGAGNGQVICDLYQEEDIPLTLSIDDFKNVTEQVKSYSKDFNLPATKRNNRIFNNMFDVTRSEDGYIFNPYVKTACLLKQDGFIIFEGFLRLIDVKDKQGQISYNVNLYSEVVALADVLKDRTFADLDFSELSHRYNFANIRNSWQGILDLLNPLPSETFAGTPGASITNVLKYPFIDWNHQLEVDTNTPVPNPVLPAIENVFRPCIQLKYLIQNIFAATDFNYTSEFFDSADFDKLYMDFNWGAENAPITFDLSHVLSLFPEQSLTGSYATFDFNLSVPAAPIAPDEFGYSAGVFTAQVDNQMYFAQLNLVFENQSLVSFLDAEVVINGVPGPVVSLQAVGNGLGGLWTWTANVSVGPLLAGDTWLIQGRVSSGTTIYLLDIAQGTTLTVQTTSNEVTDSILLQTLRGELGQWDFLKGIMTMFNLISLVDDNNPSNILIEPYNDIFVTNPLTKELDWTDKVDVSEMSLKPLDDLNRKTIFQFVEDDDDYTFMQYKKATGGHLYGSKELDASVSAFGHPTLLAGKKEIEAEPFAATVSKQLMTQYWDFVVPSIYALDDDGASEGFDNAPRIFYSNGVKILSSCTYSVPAQNGSSAVLAEDEFLQFSHLSSVPSSSLSSTDFVFESSQLFPGAGLPPIDNLFNTYWAAYFNELYHADTRVMTLKVNLSPSDLATFRFYDKVFIKNRLFRVNKIEYKPNSLAKIEFILIP